MPTSSESVAPRVQEGSYLTLHYRIELHDACGQVSVFADTFADRPATLQLGTGQWADPMEKPLLGLQEGDQLEYRLSAEQAYGRRHPDRVQKIAESLLTHNDATDDAFQPGEVVELVTPQGQRHAGIVRQYEPGWVWVDFNHPLAGHDLHVEVYILGVL